MIYEGEITMISVGRDEGQLGNKREFIEIGGTRVHNIVFSDYVYTFLDADSGEFALSTVKSGKWQIVMAIRRPNGELIKDKGQLSGVRAGCVTFPIGGFLLGGAIGSIAQSFLVFLLVWLGLGIGCPAMKYSKMKKAANALDAHT